MSKAYKNGGTALSRHFLHQMLRFCHKCWRAIQGGGVVLFLGVTISRFGVFSPLCIALA